MSSWSRPRVAPAPSFTPVNRPFLHGLTYQGGLPLRERMDALQALGVPLLLRAPVKTRGDAQVLLDHVASWSNVKVLLLIEDITAPLAWTVDHYALWGVQLGNETDLPPYNWTTERFRDRTLACYRQLRDAGYAEREDGGHIVSGGIFSVEATEANGDWHAHAYLSPLLAVAPKDLIIDAHWYGDSSDAWKARWQQLTAGFRTSVSEYGEPSRTPGEDLGQVNYYTAKHVDWHALGLEFACGYQANSGPSGSDLDNYGLWRADGSTKPALMTLGDGQ